MARTDMDPDERPVAEVIARYRLRSEREAIHFALQRLVAEPMTPDEALELEGSGWEGDLEQMRSSRVAG